MPIPHKSRYPLESFDPRLKNIWLTAIRKPVELTFESSKMAISFQNRLQQFRAALKRESPEDARMLYRAKCSRKGNILLVTKQDSEFSDVLDQIDNQLLVHSPTVSPSGPAETPIPRPSTMPESLDFSELFADIPISHITEDEP